MTTPPRPPRAWLDVPFSEKDQAKSHGARWDPAAKRWYDPRPVTAALQQWAPRADVPDLLPGEDRTFGSGLFVDMVPRTCWFTNVRTCVEERDWERLRRMIVGRAGHRCEACGAEEDRDSRRWLEAHERWSYDDTAGTQTLRRLICLCSPCHLVTHLGHANVTGRTDEALAHLRRVTGMTEPQLARHVDEAGALWTTRSARQWRLDLRILTDAGVMLREPESPAQRSRTADRTLAARRASPAPTTNEQPDPVERRASRPPEAPRPVDHDLRGAVAGQGIIREAARRRGSEGLGADRSWRLGADGEAVVGSLLARLGEPTLWGRVRGRRPPWHVVHSVPLRDEHGNERGDIDHVVVGPPGIVTINTKHHQTGKLVLDGDQLTLNGRSTDYIHKARREAARAEQLVQAALTAARWPGPAPQVRAMIVIVGGRLTVRQWAPKVVVVMTERLVETLRALPDALGDDQVAALYEVVCRSGTWAPR